MILLSGSGRNGLQDDEIFCEWKTQCRRDSEKNETGITEQILFNARSLAGYQNKLPRGLTCMIEFSNPYVDSISKSLFRNGQVNPHGIGCPAQFINTVLHAPQLKVFNQVLSLRADFGKELLNRRLFPHQNRIELSALPFLSREKVAKESSSDYPAFIKHFRNFL